jgi:hypothetical protein
MDQEVIGRPARTNSQIVRAASVSAILIVALTLSYFFLDRQLAAVLHSYTRGVPFFVWLTYTSSPLAPLASILAAFLGCRASHPDRVCLSPGKLRHSDRRCLD